VRVIAGKVGGLRLKVVPGSSTRPTTDRIKESLFAMLGDRVLQADVLDLFAGTGALSIEALSRGAKSALMVEKSPQAIQTIRHNVAHTKLDQHVAVWRADAFRTLQRLIKQQRKFHLIFVDPPYNAALVQRVFQHDCAGLLQKKGFIVVEHANKEEINTPAKNLSLYRQTSYGDTIMSIFVRT